MMGRASSLYNLRPNIGRHFAPPNGEVMLGVVNGADPGIILLDRHGQVLFANGPADNYLRAGSALQEHAGQLRPAARGLAPAFGAMMTRTLAPAESTTLAQRHVLPLPRAGSMPLLFVAVPLARVTSELGALILLHDPETVTPPPVTLLYELFGLTVAEASLCTALLDGHRLRDIAQQRGTSINTVRTLMARVFSKTGTGRQAELMRFLGPLANLDAMGIGFAAGLAAGMSGFGTAFGPLSQHRINNLFQADLQSMRRLESLISLSEFAPEGSTGMHVHTSGLEINYILRGAMRTEFHGHEARTTRVGEIIHIGPNQVHRGVNISATEPVRLLHVRLKERDKPDKIHLNIS
jgi:quercetin dioxygenase-like cupin family protein/DNA-binding CsgD family transcriptional regulator